MPQTFKGSMIATGKRFALVASRFNEFITSKLVEGAVDTLVRHGVSGDQIDIVWVPGSFEIPAVARRVARKKKYDAIVCLGCVIRGDTPHFEYVAGEVAKGVASASAESEIPILFGVLTTDTIEQAIERAGTKAGNKGSDAAAAAVELANLYAQL